MEKPMNIPVIALSGQKDVREPRRLGGERGLRTGFPNETNIEACYGGTCWVNRQFNSKFGVFENMEVRDLVMATLRI